MADTAAKTEQRFEAKAANADQKVVKGQAPEVGYDEEIASVDTTIAKTIDQAAVQQREQGIQSAAWIGLIVGLTEKDSLASIKDQALLKQLEELAAAYEQRKKERKSTDSRDSVIFEKLVSILGKPIIEKFSEAISKAAKSDAAATSGQQAASKAAVAELLAGIQSDERCKQLGISAIGIERSINQRLVELQKTVVAPMTITASRPDPSVIGPKLTESVKANPYGTFAFLSTKEGAELLRARLAVEKGAAERVSVLRSLKESLGPERFAALVDGVDSHTGVPLIALCVGMSGPAREEQRKALELSLDANQKLLTDSQRARLGSYLVGDAAAILESLRLEHQRIPDQISATERQRISNYRHLAKELGIDAPSGVSVEESRGAVMSAVAKSFPKLAGKSWEEVYKALCTLSGKEELEAFRTSAGEMGLRLIPQHLTQDELARMTEEQRAKAYTQRQEDVLKEMVDVKELSSRLFTLMREVELNEQTLADLRAILAEGPERESTRVFERLSELYVGILPEFSRERIEAQRVASGMYLENLHARIGSERDPVTVRALSAERDSIEWRALIARVIALSHATPPRNDRVNTLITEFLSAHGEGAHGRGADYVSAADSLIQALHATRAYFQQTRVFHSKELERVEQQIGTLEGKEIPEAKAKIEEQEKKVKAYWTSWSEEYKKDKAELDRLEEKLKAEQAQLKELEERSKVIQDAVKKLDESQTAALRGVVTGGSLNLGVATLQSIRANCGLSKDRDAELAAVTKGLQSLTEARQVALQQIGRVDLIGRSVCTRRDFSSSASTSASRLHQIVTADRSMNPEPARLEALRGVVPANSALGKILAQILSSGRSPREKLDLLFARLSVEEVMRIKAFLLTYDRPELFEHVGRGKQTDARAVWELLSSLKEDEKSHDISELLHVFPSLRALADSSALISQIPEAERSTVLAEYERLTSRSLIQSLLLRAPTTMPARPQFLLALCANSLVTEADLKPFFPEGKVPQGIEERHQALYEAFERDREINAELPDDFQKLLVAQSGERARLQIALPTMVHLNRLEDVRSIRRRLAELDSQFSRPLAVVLGKFGADYLARTGFRQQIEASRDIATQATSMELVDPYGDVSREARRLASIIGDKRFSADDVIGYLRRENPSPERMMVLEVMYWQHVTSRPSLGLTGDLQVDTLAKRHSSALDSEKLAKILRGVRDAVDIYDIEQLTEGLRTKNPQLTIRAMLAISAKEGGAEALKTIIENRPEIKKHWEAYIEQPAVGAAKWSAKEATRLYNAVVNNDQATIAVVKLVNGAGWVAGKGGELFGALYDHRDQALQLGADGLRLTIEAGEKVYGSEFSQAIGRFSSDAVGAVPVLWGDFLSSDPVVQAKAHTAMALSALRMPDVDISAVARAISSIPPEYRQQAFIEIERFIEGLPNSYIYRDGNGKISISKFISLKGGALGAADAEVLNKLLPTSDGRALSPEALKRYTSERQKLQLQLQEISDLRAGRQVVLDGARNFFPTIVNLHNAAKRDEQGRIFSTGAAQKVTVAHGKMLGDQRTLLAHLHTGMEDIRLTTEVMRVRSVAILEDILKEEDRGLHSEQSERDLGELRARDVAREWVSVRREVFKRWEHEANAAQKALAKLDWWLDVGYSALKVAVFVGLSMTGVGTLALLGVATAWNTLDKTYRVMARGMDAREAFRQFAIEFAIDAVCAGAFSAAARLPRLKVWTPFVRRTAEIERGAVREAGSKVQIAIRTPKAAIAGPADVTGGARKLVGRVLNQFNAKIGDTLLNAKHVALMAERIKASIRSWPFAPGSLSFRTPKSETTPLPTPPVDDTPPVSATPPPAAPPKVPDVVVDQQPIQAEQQPTTKPAEEKEPKEQKSTSELEKLVVDIKTGQASIKDLKEYLEEVLKKAGVEPTGAAKTSLEALAEAAKAGDPRAQELLTSTLQPFASSLEKMYGERDQLTQWVYQENVQDYFVALDGVLGFMNPGWKALWVSSDPPQLPPPPTSSKPSGGGPTTAPDDKKPGGGDSGGPGLAPTTDPRDGNAYTREILKQPQEAQQAFNEARVVQQTAIEELQKQLEARQQAAGDQLAEAQQLRNQMDQKLEQLQATADRFLQDLQKNANEVGKLTGLDQAQREQHAQQVEQLTREAEKVSAYVADVRKTLEGAQSDSANASGNKDGDSSATSEIAVNKNGQKESTGQDSKASSNTDSESRAERQADKSENKAQNDPSVHETTVNKEASKNDQKEEEVKQAEVNKQDRSDSKQEAQVGELDTQATTTDPSESLKAETVASGSNATKFPEVAPAETQSVKVTTEPAGVSKTAPSISPPEPEPSSYKMDPVGKQSHEQTAQQADKADKTALYQETTVDSEGSKPIATKAQATTTDPSESLKAETVASGSNATKFPELAPAEIQSVKVTTEPAGVSKTAPSISPPEPEPSFHKADIAVKAPQSDTVTQQEIQVKDIAVTLPRQPAASSISQVIPGPGQVPAAPSASENQSFAREIIPNAVKESAGQQKSEQAPASPRPSVERNFPQVAMEPAQFVVTPQLLSQPSILQSSPAMFSASAIALEDLFSRGLPSKPPSTSPPQPPPVSFTSPQQPPSPFVHVASRTSSPMNEDDARVSSSRPMSTERARGSVPTMMAPSQSSPVTTPEIRRDGAYVSSPSVLPSVVSSHSFASSTRAPQATFPSQTSAVSRGDEVTQRKPAETRSVSEGGRPWGSVPTMKVEPMTTSGSTASAAMSFDRFRSPENGSAPSVPPPSFAPQRPPSSPSQPPPPPSEAVATQGGITMTTAPKVATPSAPTMKSEAVQVTNTDEVIPAHISRPASPGKVSDFAPSPASSQAVSRATVGSIAPTLTNSPLGARTSSASLGASPASLASPEPNVSSYLASGVLAEEAEGVEQGKSKARALKKRKKLEKEEQERLRKMIMHQLLTQSFEKAKREKLLRMLASLGLTEQEYRAFLARLKTAEVTRQEAATIEKVERVAVAIESLAKPAAPSIKSEKVVAPEAKAKQPKTRADLYAQYKKGE